MPFYEVIDWNKFAFPQGHSRGGGDPVKLNIMDFRRIASQAKVSQIHVLASTLTGFPPPRE